MLVDPALGAMVVGASAGGIHALRIVLRSLPVDFGAPVFVVQHFPADAVMLLPSLLAAECQLPIEAVVDKAPIKRGHIYFAVPGYHLLIENERTLALSTDELVNWSRPSIDVLFESAARVYREQLVGILLTGGNSDGAAGIGAIKEHGGYTIVQDPTTAEAPAMPTAAINATPVDFVASLEQISALFAHSKGRNNGA